jgi:hypothetical protein
MKNPGTSLRKAFAAALASLTYDGKAVTVYSQLPIVTLPDNYVYINSMTHAQVGNNQIFIHDCSITLDVVSKQYKQLDYDVTDGIAAEVMNTLTTFPYSTLTDADFQFVAPVLASSNYLVEQDGSAWLVRKLLTFDMTLIEK